METVLTIDFDVIMWPSIELYNNMVDGTIDNLIEIEKDIPLIQYANADLQTYYKLTNYLLKAKEKKIQIEFIDTHEKILNYIKEPCNLINIDHHHDLGYNDNQWENSPICCANWAYHGIKSKLINNYFWIHGYMVTYPDERIKNIKYIDNNVTLIEYQHMIIPSKIIICSSLNWVPTNIRYLYKIWKDLFKGDI